MSKSSLQQLIFRIVKVKTLVNEISNSPTTYVDNLSRKLMLQWVVPHSTVTVQHQCLLTCDALSNILLSNATVISVQEANIVCHSAITGPLEYPPIFKLKKNSFQSLSFAQVYMYLPMRTAPPNTLCRDIISCVNFDVRYYQHILIGLGRFSADVLTAIRFGAHVLAPI